MTREQTTTHSKMRGGLFGRKQKTVTKETTNPFTGTQKTTTTTVNPKGSKPIGHHPRRVTMGDKINGAITKLRGHMSKRPAMKAAGEEQMQGADRRGHQIEVY